MRTLLTYGFYFFGVVVVIYELMKIGGLNPLTIIKDLTEKAEAEKTTNKGLSELDKKMADQMTFAVFGVIYFAWFLTYMAWSIVGLFSSQWAIFLILLIMSFVTGGLISLFKKHSNIILRVDAFMTVVLLVFMFINRFHLHWI